MEIEGDRNCGKQKEIDRKREQWCGKQRGREKEKRENKIKKETEREKRRKNNRWEMKTEKERRTEHRGVII